jgi:hypothetical protein
LGEAGKYIALAREGFLPVNLFFGILSGVGRKALRRLVPEFSTRISLEL